jgi:hypothetical protein
MTKASGKGKVAASASLTGMLSMVVAVALPLAACKPGGKASVTVAATGEVLVRVVEPRNFCATSASVSKLGEGGAERIWHVVRRGDSTACIRTFRVGTTPDGFRTIGPSKPSTPGHFEAIVLGGEYVIMRTFFVPQ